MFTKKFLDDEYYNEVIAESDNFVVIPSVGALVEGWLLIIPKRHYLSLGLINDQDIYFELEQLINTIGVTIKEEFGDYILFEHGAVLENSKVGCGVDYAHMHIVPCNFDLIKEASILNVGFEWERISNIKDCCNYANKSMPYLYYKDSAGISYATTNNNIPSQFFRKIIANKLGIGDMWDWKQNEFKENIIGTVYKLRKYNRIYSSAIS
ncbi:MAG: HIT family protein [Candidatus Nitrosocosmicus sp.]